MAWLTRHPEVVYTDLGDAAVLVHLETKFYYSLNEVALAIWKSLESAESIDDLARRLTAEYDVTEERAKSSSARFIEDLKRERLVIPG